MAIQDEIKDALPDIDFAGLSSGLLQFFIFLFISAVFGIVLYYFLLNKKFNKKIRIFQNIRGKTELIDEDKAVELKIGKGGDTVFYLKKYKKYLPRGKRPIRALGNIEYWYQIGPDGTWRNIGMGDIDEKLDQMGIEYEDDNEKYARASLQKLLKDNYDRVSFLQKYGGLIAYSFLIFITAISIWLVADKMFDVVSRADAVLVTTIDILEINKNLIGAIDNVCSNQGIVKSASGLIPAGTGG